MKRTVEAAPSLNLSWAKSYHDEPLLLDAFAERLRPLLPGRVIFTAHSLPEKALANGDPYERECRATAAAVAARVGLESYDFAFQSQGMTGDKWLGPTVEETLDRYAAAGVRDAIIHNIGFVCDHVEILWDIDVGFKKYGAERGIEIRRPESLNGSPTFTAALAEVALRCLA
jgi:ferrochelatase